MKKERNYAIDFVRFFFAMGFVIGHMAILFSRIPGRESMNLVFGLDTLCIFTCSEEFDIPAFFISTFASLEQRFRRSLEFSTS